MARQAATRPRAVGSTSLVIGSAGWIFGALVLVFALLNTASQPQPPAGGTSGGTNAGGQPPAVGAPTVTATSTVTAAMTPAHAPMCLMAGGACVAAAPQPQPIQFTNLDYATLTAGSPQLTRIEQTFAQEAGTTTAQRPATLVLVFVGVRPNADPGRALRAAEVVYSYLSESFAEFNRATQYEMLLDTDHPGIITLDIYIENQASGS